MFSPDIQYLIAQEKYKELRRDAARHQLIKAARLGRSDNSESFRRTVGWIGSRLVRWGAKLQRSDQGKPQTLTQRG